MTTLDSKATQVWSRQAHDAMRNAKALNGNGICILLLDDDEEYRDAVRTELTEMGFDVEAFASPAALFGYFRAGGSGHMLVVDWQLLVASGLDLLTQARLSGVALPAVFLTGMPTADHGEINPSRAERLRGISVLTKRMEMIAKGGAKAEAQEDDVVCGDLVLRPQVSRALWKQTDLNLTVVEYRIIELLISNCDEYVTYRAIYDAVHHAGFVAGYGEDGFRTNVRSSIKRIRNKFRAIDGEFEEIENFAGFGYRWRCPPPVEAQAQQEPVTEAGHPQKAESVMASA